MRLGEPHIDQPTSRSEKSKRFQYPSDHTFVTRMDNDPSHQRVVHVRTWRETSAVMSMAMRICHQTVYVSISNGCLAQIKTVHIVEQLYYRHDGFTQ